MGLAAANKREEDEELRLGPEFVAARIKARKVVLAGFFDTAVDKVEADWENTIKWLNGKGTKSTVQALHNYEHKSQADVSHNFMTDVTGVHQV